MWTILVAHVVYSSRFPLAAWCELTLRDREECGGNFQPEAQNSGTGEWADKEVTGTRGRKRQGEELVGRVVGWEVSGWLQLVMSRCLCWNIERSIGATKWIITITESPPYLVRTHLISYSKICNRIWNFLSGAHTKRGRDNFTYHRLLGVTVTIVIKDGIKKEIQ